MDLGGTQLPSPKPRRRLTGRAKETAIPVIQPNSLSSLERFRRPPGGPTRGIRLSSCTLPTSTQSTHTVTPNTQSTSPLTQDSFVGGGGYGFNEYAYLDPADASQGMQQSSSYTMKADEEEEERLEWASPGSTQRRSLLREKMNSEPIRQAPKIDHNQPTAWNWNWNEDTIVNEPGGHDFDENSGLSLEQSKKALENVYSSSQAFAGIQPRESFDIEPSTQFERQHVFTTLNIPRSTSNAYYTDEIALNCAGGTQTTSEEYNESLNSYATRHTQDENCGYERYASSDICALQEGCNEYFQDQEDYFVPFSENPQQYHHGDPECEVTGPSLMSALSVNAVHRTVSVGQGRPGFTGVDNNHTNVNYGTENHTIAVSNAANSKPAHGHHVALTEAEDSDYGDDDLHLDSDALKAVDDIAASLAIKDSTIKSFKKNAFNGYPNAGHNVQRNTATKQTNTTADETDYDDDEDWNLDSSAFRNVDQAVVRLQLQRGTKRTNNVKKPSAQQSGQVRPITLDEFDDEFFDELDPDTIQALVDVDNVKKHIPYDTSGRAQNVGISRYEPETAYLPEQDIGRLDHPDASKQDNIGCETKYCSTPSNVEKMFLSSSGDEFDPRLRSSLSPLSPSNEDSSSSMPGVYLGGAQIGEDEEDFWKDETTWTELIDKVDEMTKHKPERKETPTKQAAATSNPTNTWAPPRKHNGAVRGRPSTNANAQGFRTDTFNNFKPVKPKGPVVSPPERHVVPMSKTDVKVRLKAETCAQQNLDIRKFLQPIEGRQQKAETPQARSVKKRKAETEGCIDPHTKKFCYPIAKSPYKCRLDEHPWHCFSIQEFYRKVLEPLPPRMKSAKIFLVAQLKNSIRSENKATQLFEFQSVWEKGDPGSVTGRYNRCSTRNTDMLKNNKAELAHMERFSTEAVAKHKGIIVKVIGSIIHHHDPDEGSSYEINIQGMQQYTMKEIEMDMREMKVDRSKFDASKNL